MRSLRHCWFSLLGLNTIIARARHDHQISTIEHELDHLDTQLQDYNTQLVQCQALIVQAEDNLAQAASFHDPDVRDRQLSVLGRVLDGLKDQELRINSSVAEVLDEMRELRTTKQELVAAVGPNGQSAHADTACATKA